MKYYLLFVLLFFSYKSSAKNAASALLDTSIHGISVDSISGTNSIDFSRFKGKKILLVTVDVRHPDVMQLGKLQKLQDTFKNNLAIVLIPSPFVNTIISGNQATAKFLQQFNFSMVACGQVKFSQNTVPPLLQWLTNGSLNGYADVKLVGSYQKFLINERGYLVQYFDDKQNAARGGPISNALSANN
jgi:glutathione peroxidase